MFDDFGNSIDTARRGTIYQKQVGRDDSKGSASGAKEENGSAQGIRLVTLHNAPQPKHKDKKSHDQAHGKINQDLHQHPQGILYEGLISRHVPHPHEERVPHGLSLGILFARAKVRPEGIRHLLHAHLAEDPRCGLGVAHARVALGSNGIQVGLGGLHATLRSLTEGIAAEPSLARFVLCIGGGVRHARVILRLDVDGVEDGVVLPQLRGGELCAAA